MPEISPTLHTSRLLLRPVAESDVEKLLPFSYYQGEPVKDLEGVYDKLRRVRSEQATGRAVHWVMELKASGELVGSIGYYRGFADETGEVGYVAHPDHRNKGYMSEALAAVLQYGFEGLQLKAITAYTKKENVPSVRMLLRAGFVETRSEELVYKKFLLEKYPPDFVRVDFT